MTRKVQKARLTAPVELLSERQLAYAAHCAHVILRLPQPKAIERKLKAASQLLRRRGVERWQRLFIIGVMLDEVNYLSVARRPPSLWRGRGRGRRHAVAGDALAAGRLRALASLGLSTGVGIETGTRKPSLAVELEAIASGRSISCQRLTRGRQLDYCRIVVPSHRDQLRIRKMFRPQGGSSDDIQGSFA